MSSSITARLVTGTVAASLAGGATYASIRMLGREPLRPTLLVAFLVLAKLVMSNRATRRR